MTNPINKKILKQIKKYNNIIIARHVGPDPDALGSTLGLKEIIKTNFKNKNVLVVGTPASRFRFMGDLDKVDEVLPNSLLIILDTPDKNRIDGAYPQDFAASIKIDHHPFIEKVCDLEYIDDKASSASQMVIEFALDNKLKINGNAAENLFIGLVSDTNRFLFYYTTTKTFDLVSKMIKQSKLDFTKVYEKLYLRSYKDVKFEAYLGDNMTITPNGVGFVKVEQDVLDKYGVDAATAGNMIHNFNNVKEMLVWAFFTYDKNNNNVRVSIRSRGPIINDVASLFNGGGHIYASGAKIIDFTEADKLIEKLDERCIEYSNSNI